MTLQEFININNLQQADAILVRRKNIGMVNHYVVFLGYEYNRPVFVANYTKGIRVITDDELRVFLTDMEPKKILRFIGNNFEREQAVSRAISRIGENSYNLIFNNCEHYATYVQRGIHESEQVENVGKGLLLGSAAVLAGLFIAAIASED